MGDRCIIDPRGWGGVFLFWSCIGLWRLHLERSDLEAIVGLNRIGDLLHGQCGAIGTLDVDRTGRLIDKDIFDTIELLQGAANCGSASASHHARDFEVGLGDAVVGDPRGVNHLCAST